MFKVTGIEETPNPDALKFVLDHPLVGAGVKQYDNVRAASKDPLAASLFALGGVESIFCMGNFVTVSKFPTRSWDDLKPAVIKTVEEKAEVALAPAASASIAPTDAQTDEMLDKITKVLEETVVPALAADGGGLEVMGLNEYILTIHYQGACGSCPSSTSGTMMAVQNLLQRMVDPRIQVVPG